MLCPLEAHFSRAFVAQQGAEHKLRQFGILRLVPADYARKRASAAATYAQSEV